MDSNEHGAIEQNVEHHEANISIYYTHETELYAESYDTMNMGIYHKNFKTSKKIGVREKSTFRILYRSGSGSGGV